MKKQFSLILFIVFFSSNVFAALEVTISQGKVEPTPIAITDFFGSSDKAAKGGKILREIISNNLTNSGLFYTVDEDLYIQSDNLVDKVPRFEDWKVIKAQHLVAGKIETDNDKISIEFRLFDVFAQKQIVGKKINKSAEKKTSSRHEKTLTAINGHKQT